MKKFEYKTFVPEISLWKGIDFNEISKELNKLGNEGWELVSVSMVNGISVVYTFKREK